VRRHASTTDSAVSPVRAKDANGEWRPVDYSLAPVAGGFAPKSSPVDMTFSGGGTGPAATARKGSKQLDLSWSGKLPAPTIEGNHATYRLDDSTSLVLAATPTGLEESFVLSQAPADPSRLAGFKVGLGLHGLTAAAGAKQDGRVVLTNDTSKNTVKPAITISRPVVYDAQRDGQGDPTHQITVPNTLAGLGTGADSARVLA
jgi:hypothetical protein